MHQDAVDVGVGVQGLSGSARSASARVIDSGFSQNTCLPAFAAAITCGLCSECGQCVKACSAGAVQHEAVPYTQTITVGSVVLTLIVWIVGYSFR